MLSHLSHAFPISKPRGFGPSKNWGRVLGASLRIGVGYLGHLDEDVNTPPPHTPNTSPQVQSNTSVIYI